MLKKAARFFNQWGYYLLALLCVGAILLSALWTNEQRAREIPGAQALSDSSQHLSQATPAPAASLVWPVSGAILRGYSMAPLFFAETGVWQAHPALDFVAGEGAPVCALAPGRVEQIAPAVMIDHGETGKSVYRGLNQITVQAGQQIRAGQQIGLAGAEILFEGASGHICVMLLRDGLPVDFAAWLME